MASSHQQHFPTTSAPPPTPSTTTTTTTSDSAATDLLSRLLHRLPPSLSSTSPTLLRRRSSLSAATTTTIPFSDLNSAISTNLASVSESGFFQLTNHPIPSQLANSAESDSASLLNLPRHQKQQLFPKTWPLGFDDDGEDESAGAGAGESLFLDSSCSTDSDSSELSLSSLREFTREMDKIGLAVVEALTCAMGLRNPARDDVASVCSLMWISDDTVVGSGKLYPYVVGLHYQIRSQKNCSLLVDSGSVSISTQMDSILVTLGDIAQVWSNGKLNKVRGKPISSKEESTSVIMSLLVTLPLESTVSVLPRVVISDHGGTDIECHINQNEDDHCETIEENKFNSFSFEDYAWRVYHDRVPDKDPLNRYQIQC